MTDETTADPTSYPCAAHQVVKLPALSLVDRTPAEPGVMPRRVVAPGPRQGCTLPRGDVHRTQAPERSDIRQDECTALLPNGTVQARSRYTSAIARSRAAVAAAGAGGRDGKFLVTGGAA